MILQKFIFHSIWSYDLVSLTLHMLWFYYILQNTTECYLSLAAAKPVFGSCQTRVNYSLAAAKPECGSGQIWVWPSIHFKHKPPKRKSTPTYIVWNQNKYNDMGVAISGERSVPTARKARNIISTWAFVKYNAGQITLNLIPMHFNEKQTILNDIR